MKNLLKISCCIFVLLVGVSCKKEAEKWTFEQSSLEDSDPSEDGILVFIKPSFFSIDLNSYSEEQRLQAISQVQKFGQEELGDLVIADTNIHISTMPWFFVESINTDQFQLIESQVSNQITSFLANKELDLQGRKPMMQGDTIWQSRKPQMQEEWRYDKAQFTSEFITWIGGIGGQNVDSTRTVWIIDTGVDAMHQDLNGIIDTSVGYSDSPGNNPYSDENGHGTMIAGIIGARAFNQTNSEGDPADVGMNGVFPGAKMASVKIIDKHGNSNMNKLTQAIDYLLEGNVKEGDVVNISLGRTDSNCDQGQLDDKILELAGKNVYVVFSAGNETSENSTNFPSCLADGNYIISVGSMNVFCNAPNEYLVYSSFSNYGNLSNSQPIWVAPGEQIFSTMPTTTTSRGVYGISSGTSYSAAMMSGIIYTLGKKPEGLAKVTRGGDPTQYPIAKVIY